MIRALGGLALCLIALTGCPGGSTGPSDAGSDGGTPVQVTCAGGFCTGVLEPTADSERLAFTTVIRPNDTVGVAYYARTGTDSQSNGLYELRYLEWKDGQVSAAQRIQIGTQNGQPLYTATRTSGLALAVQPNGEPAVAFLGGFDGAQSFWFQNDAYLATRSAAGAWISQAVVQESNEAPSSSPVSNAGTLVGLHPALVYDGSTAYFAYRDCHSGQFPQGDYNGSDLEVAFGSGSSFTKQIIVGADGTVVGKQAYGGQSQMLIANGQPALVGDQIYNSADGPAKNVLFFKRNSNGTWTAPVTVMSVDPLQSAPTFAYDSQLGYAVAATEASTNRLTFNSSLDGVTWSPTPNDVWQSGTGGWYPSLAIDPQYHEPHIAFYHCDDRSSITEGSCRTAQDELKIGARIEGTWRFNTVDTEGGYKPRLHFLSTGKRVIVYRHPSTTGAQAGVLKIAVEQ